LKNGLGLTQQRFYLFPSIFTDISTFHLLGPGITPGHLNDDALGRTLDAIAAYDPTEHFTEIVSKRLLQSDYETYCLLLIRPILVSVANMTQISTFMK